MIDRLFDYSMSCLLLTDFGIVLGCKIYVKEITNRINMNEKDVSIQEGDIIHKVIFSR